MSEDDAALEDLENQIDLAETGDAVAQNILAARLATGRGVKKDEQGAAYWYSAAVKQGYAHAKWNLATMLLNSEGGLPENQELALQLIEQAAYGGDDSACQFLSMCYELGKLGKDVDQVKAIEWKERAYKTRQLKVFGEKLDIESFLGISLKKPIIVKE